MVKMSEIVEMLQNMRGSINVFPVDPDSRQQIIEIERGIKGSMGLPVINAGLEETLSRQFVICIVKNNKFRPPPEPTVLLMADTDLVLGEEVLPGMRNKYENREDVIFLSDDFVMFPERRGKTREYFVMPPVSFPEIAQMDGMRNVVSCSPSAPSDMMLRKLHGLDDDPKLASILVGFDSDNVEC